MNNIFNPDEFINCSLKNKMRDLLPIHIEILKYFYDDGKKHNCIEENNLSSKFLQCLCFLEIHKFFQKKYISFTKQHLGICINDLEVCGFIFNVRDIPYQDLAYSITQLGIEAVVHLKNHN